MADVTKVRETIQGQPQADQEAVVTPHDGSVDVRETRVALDSVILDPNSPDAVQIPEEVGTVQDRLTLPAERLSEPSPNEVFGDVSGDEKAEGEVPSTEVPADEAPAESDKS